MARILFGGPQEEDGGKPNNIHDDLVSKLKENYDLTYVTRGDEMMHELTSANTWKKEALVEPYNVILYDTGLFYDKTSPERRAKLFSDKVIDFLKMGNAPVIVLAQAELADKVKDSNHASGLRQINQPYNISEVIETINYELNP